MAQKKKRKFIKEHRSQSERILPVIREELFPQNISKEINNPTKNRKAQFIEKNDKHMKGCLITLIREIQITVRFI